jgi:hypothetical protein
MLVVEVDVGVGAGAAHLFRGLLPTVGRSFVLCPLSSVCCLLSFVLCLLSSFIVRRYFLVAAVPLPVIIVRHRWLRLVL